MSSSLNAQVLERSSVVSVDSDEPLPSAPLHNSLLEMVRLPQHLSRYPELKDPSVVQLPDGTFMMFASIGQSVTQEWIVGRFRAVSPTGPWQELEPVVFQNIAGPQLCAPAVTLEEQNGQLLWKMYIQTACFEADGVIALATSSDGQTFIGQPQPLASRTTIVPEHQSTVIGVYDAAISEIKTDQEELLYMLFSGYRRVGCGDVYASYRKKNAPESEWSPATRLLAQEEVPFHNHPEHQDFEWGLEGAKLIQLHEHCFVLIGVCFLPLPRQHIGTKQRVFFAVSSSPQGPFTPVCTPFTPYQNQGKAGENGHPDTLIIGHDLWIIYQERWGDGQPWHLRCAKYYLPQLTKELEQFLIDGDSSSRSSLTHSSASAEDTAQLPAMSAHEASAGSFYLSD